MQDKQVSRRGRALRAARNASLAIATLAGLSVLAQDLSAIKVPPRFARPAADTDEGGLWGLMDREESRLKRSPATIRDKALQDYLTGLVCKLSDGHCPDIRVHAVRNPQFNALMAPNGMMLVWSGLLLRAENEAQLVAILGHELGHYLERHQVEQLRAAKDHAILAQMVGLVGGVGGVIGSLGIQASMFAFSRDHETRADRMGMRLMQQAGYDGREAAAVWENLLAELKVTGGKDAGKNGDLFSTHPTTAGRRDELLALAGAKGGATNDDAFRKAIAPLRFGWIQDEIKRGQYEESLILFERMIRRDAQDAEARFARGEVYRLRDEGTDVERALADLQAASTMDKAPPAAFRSLGLLHKQRNDRASALAAFETYLAKAPQAPDAAMVRSYVEELK
jgi:predicted Zn-dependent protease